MTLFEYLSVAVSIVLALGVAHLLANVRQVLDRRRAYWVHATWAGLLLLIYALEWWSLWALRDANWSFGGFVLVLVGPGLLYACSTVLVPTALETDWRSHYYTVHRFLFVALLALLIQTTLMIWFLGDLWLLSPRRPLWFVFVAGALAGATTPRPRVHAGIAIATVVLLVYLSVDLLWPENVL